MGADLPSPAIHLANGDQLTSAIATTFHFLLDNPANMSAVSFQFPVVAALVTRHAEDAAFYWSQLDRASTSPQVGLERLQHFNLLLSAHLDGLTVAGHAGWKPSIAALQRWNKSGEAFVCTWLGAQHAGEGLDEVLLLAQKNPAGLLRGIISALAWLPTELSRPVIERWSTAGAQPVAQIAALRAAALIGPNGTAALQSSLSDLAASAHFEVRAAVCRAAPACRHLAEADKLLQPMLADAELTVRAEASIALGRMGRVDDSFAVLQQCVIDQSAIHALATGWNRIQSARRLERWVRELAWLTPLRSSVTAGIVATLPPRVSLTFVLVHGDPAYLPFVVEQSRSPELSRYAGWIWQTLTGIDITTSGWTLSEPAPSTIDPTHLITEARLDADNGLPQPDSSALQTFMDSHPQMLQHGTRVLLGRDLDVSHALHLVENAPQAIRLLAARKLNQAETGVTIRVRGPVKEQRIATARARNSAAGQRVP